MNQQYRIRLKSEVKLKIALIGLACIALLSVIFWQLINSNFFKQQDVFNRTNFLSVKPETCRYFGKYLVYKCKFKIRSGVYFETELVRKPNHLGKYCIAEIYKNGDFVKFALDNFDKCV